MDEGPVESAQVLVESARDRGGEEEGLVLLARGLLRSAEDVGRTAPVLSGTVKALFLTDENRVRWDEAVVLSAAGRRRPAPYLDRLDEVVDRKAKDLVHSAEAPAVSAKAVFLGATGLLPSAKALLPSVEDLLLPHRESVLPLDLLYP
jgi:hypothetical protein